MKKKTAVCICLAFLCCTLFAACNTTTTVIEEPPESAVSVPVSSETVEVESSIPTSSEDTSSAEPSSLPESSEIPESQATQSQAAVSSNPPAVSSQAPKVPPVSSETSKVPPASSQTPKTPPKAETPASSKVVSSKPASTYQLMTEAEVDTVIAEAIAYAESKGFYVWQDKYSIESNGYYLPANSTEGKAIFKRDLFYEVDHLYQIALEDTYWQEGMDIYYKIMKGPIEDQENAWFAYVLY